MPIRRVNLNTEWLNSYLKAIFTLGGPERSMTSTALAEQLGVDPESITNKQQRLAASPPSIVEYEPRRDVRLSAAAWGRALEIMRHHRLLQAFLYKGLNYPVE